eukprot:COSAG01_NODE_22560_length_850_cov_1.640479_2_plen_114_part_00
MQDDCTIRKWDVETGKMTGIIDEDHTKKINDIQFSACRTHFISASSDTTAKLFDFHSMDSAPPVRTPLLSRCFLRSPLLGLLAHPPQARRPEAGARSGRRARCMTPGLRWGSS